MSGVSSGVSPHRRARAEAAAWIVKLHGPSRSREVEAAFRHWLAQSAQNAREFEKVTEVWDGARGVPRPAAHRRQRPLLVLAKAASVILLFGVGAFLTYQHWTRDSYTTRIGEQRLVRLEDGSRLSLNSDSAVEVHYTRARRLLALTRGEAYFEVAQNTARPFVVSAGGHNVTALGTAFVVRYEPEQTAVILVEGRVSVSNTANSSPDASPAVAVKQVLAPGERLVLARNAAPRLDSPRIDTVTAWRHGEVVLERTPLAEAIAEMNRYEDDKLVLDSPAIGDLQISGIYHTGDSAGFAQSVARLYHLEVTESGKHILLSRSPVR
ncbi:MAG: FecR domain-containing protein [Proteobacteria bacterium]|nr:FecR domain-containing protein [Pseudomonadota bacterium]